MPLIVPTKATLKKYGLSLEKWQEMADKQNHACSICKLEPKKGRLHIEHEHVKGWKKLPPEQRALYIRSLACYLCNTQYLGRGITIERSKAVTACLEEYALRRPATVPKPPKTPKTPKLPKAT